MAIFDSNSPGLLGKAGQWMTPERGMALAGLGQAFSQLGAGQPVDLSSAHAALQQRRERQQAQQALQSSGLMEKFSPEQRAILAQMEPSAAQKIIASVMFAPPPDPVKGTDDMREYEYAVGQGYKGSFQDFMIEMRRAGAANQSVTVGGEPAPSMGTIPQGFAVIPDENEPSGFRMVAIPGGPEDTTKQDAVAQENKERGGGVVVDDISRALEIIEKNPNLTTGVGAFLKGFPGTDAKSLSGLIQTIKANVGFDRLQQMRDASKTGGALGAINKTEMDLLTAALGNLDQSLDDKDLAYNLNRINDIYLDIIHGPGQRPAPVTTEDVGPEAATSDVLTEEERKFLGLD